MKKPVKKAAGNAESADVSAVQLGTVAPTVDVANVDAGADDADSAVDDEADAVSDVQPEAVAAAPVAKAVTRMPPLGLAPNPSLEDMNRAARAQYAQRSDVDYAAAQKALARAFGRRGGRGRQQ